MIKMFQEKTDYLTILYISANYDESQVLWTNKEFMAIKDTIEKSPYKKHIHLEPALALERHKIRELILKNRPQIVHFAGHGELDKGPLLQDDKYQKFLDLLSETISILGEFKDIIKLIIFNTCNSFKIAEGVAEFIECVIGTNKDINDKAAIGFSKGFYKIFGINESVENAFKNGLDKYALKYKQNREDYIFLQKDRSKEGNLESFLGVTLWEIFTNKFDPNLRPYLKWGLILSNSLVPIELNDFVFIFSKFLKEFLKISLNNKLIKKIVAECDPNNPKSIIQNILDNIEDPNINNFIQNEEIFAKIIRILEDLKSEIKNNLEIFNLLIESFYSKLKEEDNELYKILRPKIIKFKIEWEKRFDLLTANIQKPLTHYRIKNQDNIINFTTKELFTYCQKQLELADLSSQYGYRFNENLFEKDLELDSIFERFFENIVDKNNRERIFLLLGHMGLGKTWNASYLAFKYVKRIPTFYYHLGSSYETQFDFTLGGFDLKESRISKLINPKNKKPRKILIVFDGFDELSTDERIEFLPNLTQLIKENSENLMVLLTSRMVDWVNTSEISRKARHYKQYIFKKEEFYYYEGSPIRTGASYILSDIHDQERLKKINENYGINYEKIKDSNVRELLRKPFVINIISRGNKELVNKELNPQNREWFDLFANPYINDTILKRMGIFDEIEDTFQELVCEIADPYNPIPEDDLKEFINENKQNWDVIYSSGIIRKNRRDLQYEYYFKEEYQGFIEQYIVDLKANLHGNWICKADVNSLKKIENEIGKSLNDVSDFRDKQAAVGYVINKFGRVVELHLWNSSLKFIPSGVLKLIGLKKLNLRKNTVIKIPKSLSRLINLKELDISENQIISIPRILTNLRNLIRFNLMKNQIQSLDSYWRDFECLKFINISENSHKIGHEKRALPSIDFVADNLDVIDDKISYFLQMKKDYEFLKIKDAVIIDYLNYLRLNLGNKFSFSYTCENYSLKSLTLTESPELKELFWSIENLETLRLLKNQTKFIENSSIKNLDIIDTSKQDENFELDLFESIDLLENLETLNIRGFSTLTLPNNLNKCMKLRHVYIFSKKLKNFPLLTLELQNIHNIIINSPIEENEFDSLIKNIDKELNIGLVRFATNINLPNLTIKPHIKNFFLTHVQMLPNEIKIECELKKLIIIQSNQFPSRFFEKIQSEKNFGTGTFFLHCKTFTFPLIINDFKKLTHLRIDNSQMGTIPDWVFKSPLLKRLLITSDNLPTTPEEFFKDVNQGICEIRVHINCNLSNIETELKNLTHLRINMPNLQTLPKFIDTLTQMNQLLINQRLGHMW